MVNLATADPGKLVRLLQEPGREVEATGMIAIPKKRKVDG